jgi:hypothetical protein
MVSCIPYMWWFMVYGVEHHFQQYFSYILAVSFIGDIRVYRGNTGGRRVSIRMIA